MSFSFKPEVLKRNLEIFDNDYYLFLEDRLSLCPQLIKSQILKVFYNMDDGESLDLLKKAQKLEGSHFSQITYFKSPEDFYKMILQFIPVTTDLTIVADAQLVSPQFDLSFYLEESGVLAMFLEAENSLFYDKINDLLNKLIEILSYRTAVANKLTFIQGSSRTINKIRKIFPNFHDEDGNFIGWTPLVNQVM